MKDRWRIVLRVDPTISVAPHWITYLVSLAPKGFTPWEYLPDKGDELVIGGLECVAENVAQVSLAALGAAQALRTLAEKKGTNVSQAFETVIYFEPVKE